MFGYCANVKRLSITFWLIAISTISSLSTVKRLATALRAGAWIISVGSNKDLTSSAIVTFEHIVLIKLSSSVSNVYDKSQQASDLVFVFKDWRACYPIIHNLTLSAYVSPRALY